MSTNTEHPSKCHVLGFLFDDDDASAFTFLVNDTRFHVIIEPKKLETEGYDGVGPELQYLEKLREYKAKDNPDAVNALEKKSETEESPSSTITEPSEPKTPKIPKNDEDVGTELDDDDSAIDCGDTDGKEESRDLVSSTALPAEAEKTIESTENQNLGLQNWILSYFGHQVEVLATAKSSNKPKSIREWYNPRTYFFELAAENNVICPIELEDNADLWKRVNDLVPKIPLPKYIRDFDIPWVQSSKLEVLSESDAPQPLHPSTVRMDNSILFFKPVDATQPSPTKREIKILKQIEKLGLHKEFRVPVVSGLVGYEDSKIDAMGFLLTNIENPTPLTTLLDSGVPQTKRNKWAQESERIVRILHDNEIVWGDAKADNFMVDKNDDLWIIDFGGSYTDGWIDPELMETKEGDEMGVEKIVNALDDPDVNTFDNVDEPIKFQKVAGTARDENDTSRKRKHSDANATEKDENLKRQR